MWPQGFYKGKRKSLQPDTSAHPDSSAGEMVLNTDKVDVSGVCSFPVLLAVVGDSSISTGELMLSRCVQVWTSVFFEMKIILWTSNAIFASPCKTKLLLLEFRGTPAWELGKHFQGEWALHTAVYVLFPYDLHIIIAEDPETKNCSVTHPL